MQQTERKLKAGRSQGGWREARTNPVVRWLMRGREMASVGTSCSGGEWDGMDGKHSPPPTGKSAPADVGSPQKRPAAVSPSMTPKLFKGPCHRAKPGNSSGKRYQDHDAMGWTMARTPHCVTFDAQLSN